MSNSAPVAQALSVASQEDGPSVLVTAIFTDVDVSDTHIFTINTTGTLGTVTNNNDGTFSYDPNGMFEQLAAGVTATDIFTYTVDDGNGGTSTETVTVTITGQNDAPVALAVNATTDEDTLAATFTPDFSDLDATDTHTISFDTGGSASASPITDNGDGTYTYTANDSYDGLALGESATEAFTYTVNDGNGGTSTETVTVTIEGRNDAPVAAAVSGNVDENGIAVTIAASFTDVDTSDTHTFTTNTTGTLGAVTNNNDGTFSYDPNGQFESLAAGATTTDTFTYTVDDGNGGTSTETVTVTITGQNDAPVALAVNATTDEDTLAATFTPDFSDVDATDTHTITFDTGGSASASPITDNGDGTYTYTANDSYDGLALGENATEAFTYTVNDGNGGTSTQTVTVTIEGRNDAPVAAAVSGNVDENGIAVTIAASFTDVDTSDTHTFTTNTIGTLGAVTNNNDGTFSYDPNGKFESLAAGATTTDTFTYTVDDGNGGTSTETVTVTITGQNDAPVVAAIAAAANEDGPAVIVTASFTDIDTPAGHTFTTDTTGTLGAVTNNLDSTFSYNPNGKFENLAAGESATDTFTYTVNDGNGGSATETVTVTITGQNDVVVAADIATLADEDTVATITASFTDADVSDTHIFSVDTTGTVGSVTNNNDGSFSYNPNSQFEQLAVGETATDAFAYTVDDGNGGTSTKTVSITIEGRNDAPVVTALAATTTEDGPSVTVTAAFTDLDVSDTHSLTIDTTGTLGTVTDNLDGTYSYDPNGQFEQLNPGQTATDTFTYTANDGNGGVTTETVTITIEGQVEPTKLIASDGATSDSFGEYVASNDLGQVLVGANGDDDAGAQAGSAYVYTPNSLGGYTQIKLAPTGVGANDLFGYSVALSNTGFVAIGSPLDDDKASNSGAVYVFTPDAGGGYTQQKLTLSDGGVENRSGVGLSINDNGDVAIGRANHGGVAGSVYVNTRDGSGNYTEVKLSASDGVAGNQFGYSASINNAGVVYAGAFNQNGSGAAYIYHPDGLGGYTETKIVPSDGLAGDALGFSGMLNASGTLVVGAHYQDGAANDAGAIYVYEPDGAGGYVETKLVATDAQAGDLLGFRVAINDNGTIVAGARDEDDNGSASGAAYVFVPSVNGGYTQFKLTAHDGMAGDKFGNSVDVNSDGVVTVGARYGDGLSADTGAVYTYVPDPSGNYVGPDGTVYQGTYLEPNVAPVATAISGLADEDGPSVTVTASFTDANASDTHTFTVDTTGTLGTVVNNGDGTFTYSPNAAFQYLATGETATDTFTYTVNDGQGGTSTQTATITINGADEPAIVVTSAKLIASDGIGGDYFGEYVASNDLGQVLVGANGDDDAGAQAGSAYVYTPNSLGGYTQTKLAPTGVGANDLFGYSVALSNTGFVAIGSPLDDDKASNSGAVYVFTPDAGGGYTQQKLTLSDGGVENRSGVGLSINDDGDVAIGRTSPGAGAVYVNTRDGSGNYTEVKLSASDGVAGNQFGYSASINNAGVVYAGAFSQNGSGAAYVYQPDGLGGYTETKIVPSDGLAGDAFGFSGMLSADGTLVVGAFSQDGAASGAGAVYVYQPDGAGGYVETKLVATDAQAGDLLGFRVATSENGIIVAGARDEDDNGSASGAAYVFVPSVNGGYTQFKLTAHDGMAGDKFGNSVDVNSDGVVTVGARYGDGISADTGAVYTYIPDANGDYHGHDGTVYTGLAADSTSNPATITGTLAAEQLLGGAGNDVISGLGGDDVITGAAGNDALTGGAGSDTFIFRSGDTGHDTIADFIAGAATDDVLQFAVSVFADYAAVVAATADVGADAVITVDANTTITLQGILTAGLHQDDFQFI